MSCLPPKNSPPCTFWFLLTVHCTFPFRRDNVILGIYRHHSHTVRTTEIMGIIRCVQRKTVSIIYACRYVVTSHRSCTSVPVNQVSLAVVVDDGTGVIQCVIWIPDEYRMIRDTSLVPGLKTFEQGQVVRVTGCPGEYRGEMQLTVQPGDVCKHLSLLFSMMLKAFRDSNLQHLHLQHFAQARMTRLSFGYKF